MNEEMLNQLANEAPAFEQAKEMIEDIHEDVHLKIFENAELGTAEKDTIASTVALLLLGHALAFVPNKYKILAAVFAGALTVAEHIEGQENGVDQ